MNPLPGIAESIPAQILPQKKRPGKLVTSTDLNPVIDAVNRKNAPAYGGRRNSTGQQTVLVKLDQTTGSDGTATTPPTWKYTVKDIAGNTIRTNVAPIMQRSNGSTTPAKIGQWFPYWFDDDNPDGALVDCDEAAVKGPC